MKRRPKHVDFDKPRGYIKRKLKRWARRVEKAESDEKLRL